MSTYYNEQRKRYENFQKAVVDKVTQIADYMETHGGGGATPDWNAAAGADGYIANKPDVKAGTGSKAVAEGFNTTASGYASHAEGTGTQATTYQAHAEGRSTTASGTASHAEGSDTQATGSQSHAEGYGSQATGDNSHAEGYGTRATHQAQHAGGAFNVPDPSQNAEYERGTYIEIIGNGADNAHRSNARTLDWNGNEALAGGLTLGKGTANEVTMTAEQVQYMVAATPKTVETNQTTATIAAEANTTYFCTVQAMLELNFTPSATGLCEVIFASGSTPTVLTLPNTVIMPDWWTGVEANRIYDIMILNGMLGAVMSWAA